MSPADDDGDPGNVTLAAYQASAAAYLEHSAQPTPSVLVYLERFADLTRPGPVLELGSGPGWDADHLEQTGVRVIRSDATAEFVALLRAAGHEVRSIDIRHDEFGGPYPGVFADAVLLHLSRDEFAQALRRCHAAVVPGGVLGLTLKEGDGDEWTTEKIDQPRFFTYWRESALRAQLIDAGWEVVEVERTVGRRASWLLVIARRPATASR